MDIQLYTGLDTKAQAVTVPHDYFPVRRSRIHLRRAAHPEGEVDAWAGGGMEGKEPLCVSCVVPPLWVLIRDPFTGARSGWTPCETALKCATSQQQQQHGSLCQGSCVTCQDGNQREHKPDWCERHISLNHTRAQWENRTRLCHFMLRHFKVLGVINTETLK